MRVHRAIAVSLLYLTASAQSATAPASQAEYSADYVMETAEGAIRGHLNVAPGKERREDAMEGTTTVMIRRDDLKKMWMLMPSERMYMEMNAGQPAMGEGAPDPNAYQTEMTTVGREELDGLMTTKSKVVMTGKDGKMGGFWWTTDQGVVVKMDVIGIDGNTKMRMKRELSNIKLGPQDASLFEIPKGYSSMATGMGVGMAKGVMGLPDSDVQPQADGTSGEEATSEQTTPKKKGWGLGRITDVLKGTPQ